MKKAVEELLLLLATTLLAGLLGGLEHGLEGRRGLECEGLRSFNLELFTGAGVAAGAGCAGLHLKRTETNNLYLLTGLNGIGNSTEYCGKSCFCALLGGVFPESGLNAANKFCLIHRSL